MQSSAVMWLVPVSSVLTEHQYWTKARLLIVGWPIKIYAEDSSLAIYEFFKSKLYKILNMERIWAITLFKILNLFKGIIM